MDDLAYKLDLLYQIKDETNQYKLLNLIGQCIDINISKEAYMNFKNKKQIDKWKKDCLKLLNEIEDILNES